MLIKSITVEEVTTRKFKKGGILQKTATVTTMVHPSQGKSRNAAGSKGAYFIRQQRKQWKFKQEGIFHKITAGAPKIQTRDHHWQDNSGNSEGLKRGILHKTIAVTIKVQWRREYPTQDNNGNDEVSNKWASFTRQRRKHQRFKQGDTIHNTTARTSKVQKGEHPSQGNSGKTKGSNKGASFTSGER